jgi:hypothetical protein
MVHVASISRMTVFGQISNLRMTCFFGMEGVVSMVEVITRRRKKNLDGSRIV